MGTFASSKRQRAFAATNSKQASYDHIRDPSEISQKPWKYHGQDQIVQLELELDKLDRDASDFNPADKHNGRFRDGEDSERKELLEKIDAAMEHYHQLLLRQDALRNLPQANSNSLQQIKNWLYNHGGVDGAVDAEETEYLNRKFDLAMLTGRDSSVLTRLLEHPRILSWLEKWHDERNVALDTDAGRIRYTSDERIAALSSAIVLLIGATMLIAPIWILAYAHSRWLQLLVATLFILTFIGVLSSTARPFETLAGAAAYSAVLMVFLQINS